MFNENTHIVAVRQTGNVFSFDVSRNKPVTFKVFNENTHIVAVRQTGNVFSFDVSRRLKCSMRIHI